MTEATQAKFYATSYNLEGWFQYDAEIHWNETPQFVFEIKPNDTEFTEYRIDISGHKDYKEYLKRLRLDLALGVTKGSWEIESITVE